MGYSEAEVQQAREACEQAYKLFKEGKLDEMLGYIGADATLKSPVKYKPVERGDFELSGRDEIRDYLQNWFDTFDATTLQQDIDAVAADGNASPDGKAFRNHPEAHAMVVKYGKMLSFQEWHDPYPITQACKE